MRVKYSKFLFCTKSQPRMNNIQQDISRSLAKLSSHWSILLNFNQTTIDRDRGDPPCDIDEMSLKGNDTSRSICVSTEPDLLRLTRSIGMFEFLCSTRLSIFGQFEAMAGASYRPITPIRKTPRRTQNPPSTPTTHKTVAEDPSTRRFCSSGVRFARKTPTVRRRYQLRRAMLATRDYGTHYGWPPANVFARYPRPAVRHVDNAAE